MFFYRKKSKSGEVLQLLESYRNKEGRSRHQVVVSLGNAGIPEKSWKKIAKYVESILYGYAELFTPEPGMQLWIDSIIKRVEREGSWQPALREKILLGSRDPEGDESSMGEVVDGVFIDQIEHTHETTLGPELVGLKAWETLEIDNLLKDFGFSGPQRRAAAASVINRLVDPVTENRLRLWLQTSSLPDLLGEDCLHCDHDKYYKVSDLLYRNQEEIEKHLSSKVAAHFGFERTYILYDLTNTHFEGECQLNPKAKRGRNKQKRHDCPQVVVGVCFDEHGFVLFHKTFSGNMSDSKSLLEMVLQMQNSSEEANLFTPQSQGIVIIDAGIATSENVKLLREKGFSYLVNETRQSRNKYAKYFNEKAEFVPVKKGEKYLEVKVRTLDISDGQVETEESLSCEKPISDEILEKDVLSIPVDANASESTGSNHPDENEIEPLKERLVLCCSKPRSAKEEAILSGTKGKFIDALKRLSTRIKKGQLKDSTKIERSIGKIQACHSRASKYYEVTYEPPEEDKTTPQKKRVSDKEKSTLRGILLFHRKDQSTQADSPADPLLGCYVLRTDQRDMPAERLWHLYMTLPKAEDGFRSLKHECGLRPNHHQLEHRVDAHIFISIIAYQLQRFILYKLELCGDHRNWITLRRILQTHTYSTLLVPTNTGVSYRIRKPGIPEECQHYVYKQLDIELGKLPKTKIAVKNKSATL